MVIIITSIMYTATLIIVVIIIVVIIFLFVVSSSSNLTIIIAMITSSLEYGGGEFLSSRYEQIILFGRSVGSGPTVYLASRQAKRVLGLVPVHSSSKPVVPVGAEWHQELQALSLIGWSADRTEPSIESYAQTLSTVTASSSVLTRNIHGAISVACTRTSSSVDLTS